MICIVRHCTAYSLSTHLALWYCPVLPLFFLFHFLSSLLPLPSPTPLPLSYRYDAEHRVHCCSMCLTFILLTVVIVGEVLIVAAGDTRRVPWRAAFTPFYLLFILSCSVCFWPVWKCRSCEVGILGGGGRDDGVGEGQPHSPHTQHLALSHCPAGSRYVMLWDREGYSPCCITAIAAHGTM